MDLSVLLGLVSTGAGLLGRKRGARDAWQTAAEAYGLRHKPSTLWSGPKLSGPLSGNELTVDIKDRNTSSAATRFRLGVPSLNLGLKLKKRGFWNSLRSRIPTGDQAFDSQVVATARNEFAVREFLTPERRKAIQSFLGSFKGAVITDNEISFKTRGHVKDADELLGAIDAIEQLAGVLAAETRSASVAQGEGAPVAAIAGAELVEPVAPEPEPEPEPEANRNLAPAEEAEIQDLESPAEDADEPMEPEVAATAASDSPMLGQSSPSLEDFCAAVFAPGTLSFSANQIFQQSYKGERIAWTGTLESVTPFTFDFDFGSGRGTKAVLTLVDSEVAGSRKVQAVIGLPHGSEALDARIGQAVSFTGRLLKVDGLAKRVVIADAEIVERSMPSSRA